MRGRRFARRAAIAAMAAALLGSLTGCMDAVEVDEEIYVINLGIEFSDRGHLLMTAQVPTASAGGGSGGGSMSDMGGSGGSEKQQGGPPEGFVQGEFVLTQVEAATVPEGVDMLRASLPRLVSFQQIKTVIVSEEVARSDIFLRTAMDLANLSRFRRGVELSVCRTSPTEYMKMPEPHIGLRFTKSQEAAMDTYAIAGYTTSTPLSVFLSLVGSGYGHPVTSLSAINTMQGELDPQVERQPGSYVAGELPRLSGNQEEVFGAALFDDERMVGMLTGYETQLLMMLQGKVRSMLVNITMDDGGRLDVELAHMRKAQLEADYDPPAQRVFLQMRAVLQQPDAIMRYDEGKIEDRVERQIETDVQDLLFGLNQMRIDPAQFASSIAREFWTRQEFQRCGWYDKLPDATRDVTVEIAIDTMGYSIAPIMPDEGVNLP